MFKSAMFVTSINKSDFIPAIDRAIECFKTFNEYDSTKEYTVTYDHENNVFDIWELM